MEPLRRDYLQKILNATLKKINNLSDEYKEVENTGPTPGDAWGQHDAMVRGGLCKAAAKNVNKNRYSNLYPFDHSRFVLEVGDKDDDYINASWINLPGLKSSTFILTMAPLDHTIPDFWQMVEQTRSRLIVTLCKVEAGYQGCSQYFPPKTNMSEAHGHYNVTVAEEKQIDEATVDRLIKIKSEKQETEHTVRHLQFNLWPNYGVVSNIPQFAEFFKQVYDMSCDTESPVIVHCSGGIGRSGTFTAIYAVYSLFNQYIQTGDEKCLSSILDKDAVSIVGLVKMMREQRHPWMVEGEQQFKLAYSTILHLLQELIEK